ncbi:putative queuosine, q, salvage protein family protein [Hirsutella rhossiliensis]|uniref:Queuosine 5'-phosphate N-glycosylase/hydrolase n=1 Tax=Hirsutella rhossiliensis TaxID=111463 RepID=A0A9P8MT60_9HYPO|nr:putative queuosine, q, salvage protein family domain-containing protein [Hirsutella rhossiliensis]KAH0960835.1 putative queuosine, q, salvage protein family domain-containing protein [Hirsutella rhossiliensis]
MSDDEVDLELLDLLRNHLQGKLAIHKEPETGVLEGAEYVYDNGVDVAIDMRSTKAAAETIYAQMQQTHYSTATWSEHQLHPQAKDEQTVAFIFTMDLLNFSFWSELPDDECFAVDYRGKQWTGYWSLVAALQRALDDDIPITAPHFWQNEDECNLETLRHVFRSCTDEEMPMLQERLACLRESGQVLYERYDSSFINVVSAAGGSAARLVNLLAHDFSCFRDEHTFNERHKPVRFLKRAQILVADLWACFQGESWGKFRDIDKITMFADYRVPQILISMGALYCCPSLSAAIKDKRLLESGASWEVQLRACSIWCVEMIRREILRQHPGTHVNAILIDFFLYDKMKELEEQGRGEIPHHRTRSIWY